VTPEGVNSFQQLMASMVNRMAEQGLNSPPEERFRVQLETLESMGFVDRQANIQGKLADPCLFCMLRFFAEMLSAVLDELDQEALFALFTCSKQCVIVVD